MREKATDVIEVVCVYGQRFWVSQADVDDVQRFKRQIPLRGRDGRRRADMPTYCDRLDNTIHRDNIALPVVPRYDEPFTLDPTPAPQKPVRAADVPTTQKKLLDGLDCLPGQLDLF